MTMAAKGVAKLMEECGELIQVLGKKLACWDADDHWDGTYLPERMVEEMGDVRAAIQFVAERLGLDITKIQEREAEKLATYHEWEADERNNDHGIDGHEHVRIGRLVRESGAGVFLTDDGSVEYNPHLRWRDKVSGRVLHVELAPKFGAYIFAPDGSSRQRTILVEIGEGNE